MISDKRKYLLSAAFLVLVTFCLYFTYALSEVNEALLLEALERAQYSVDVTINQMDRVIAVEDNWGDPKYERGLRGILAEINATGTTYAELFDDEFNSLSERVYQFPKNPTRLLEHPQVLAAVQAQDYGVVHTNIDNSLVPPFDMVVYFRWTPLSNAFDHRLLTVIGVSKYSVEHESIDGLMRGVLTMLVICCLLFLLNVFLFCALGEVYIQRKRGQRWRCKRNPSKL